MWVAAGLLVHVVLSASVESAERPNVIFIAIDDLNDWIGCLAGHPQAQTPNIDQLADRGILFTNAHCAAPACNPSRAAVFSGRMPYQTEIWSNDSPKLIKHRPSVPLLPSVLSAAGYQTLGTGKLLDSGSANAKLFKKHFNVDQRWSPFTKDKVKYTTEEADSKATSNPQHSVEDTRGNTVVLPLNRMPSDRRPNTIDGESFDWGPVHVPESDMGDTQITDWALERLREQKKRPFFLCVGYYRPHIPLYAPAKYFKRFESSRASIPSILESDLDDLGTAARRWALEPITAGSHSTVVANDQWQSAVEAYLACVTYVDAQVGRLVAELDRSSFAANTIIILWSDHGWHLGEKQHWGKWTPWERSTRVPLIIVPPRLAATTFAQPGSRCRSPVSLLDLFPTLVELCNAPRPTQLDGRSLVPLLQDPLAQSNRTAITHFDPGNVSLRTDRWRYIKYSDGSEELYDHSVDPNEWNNLANSHKHSRKLDELRDKVPQNWIGN